VTLTEEIAILFDGDNYDIAKLYRANPFHIALGMTKELLKKGSCSGKDLIITPEMPGANDCDSILLTILQKYLDTVFVEMGGFKEFGDSVNFHKAFRSMGVTGIDIMDSIAWDAIHGSELFNYFYNKFVLGQFEEWKKMIEGENL